MGSYMTLDTLITQLHDAKTKRLIVQANILPSGTQSLVTVTFPATIQNDTLDELRQFLKDTFPGTTIQSWRYSYTLDELYAVCMSFTVDAPYTNQNALVI